MRDKESESVKREGGCMYVCMFVHVYIPLNRERERDRERKRRDREERARAKGEERGILTLCTYLQRQTNSE